MASERTDGKQVAPRKEGDAGDEVGGGALQLLAPVQAPWADVHDVDARRAAAAHAGRSQNWLAAVHAHAPVAAFLLALQPAQMCTRHITTRGVICRQPLAWTVQPRLSQHSLGVIKI